MNIPLQIYDFIAVLFPSLMVLGIVRREVPWLPVWHDAAFQFGNVAFMFVAAYVLGHVISWVSESVVERTPVTRWFFARKERQARPEREVALRGRKVTIHFDKPTGDAILQALSKLYGYEVRPEHPNIWQLAYSPIQDRLVKRDAFLAIAGMMRSLVAITSVYLLYLTGKIALFIGWGRYQVGELPFVYDAVLIGVCLVAWVAFLEAYHRHLFLSDMIPFRSFLAWYSEKQMRAS